MIGSMFLDRYKIVEKLGSGGTAVCYKAVDTVLNRDVTVKILQDQFANNQKFILRFRKEARAVAQLSHPNIVSVYDVGVSEDNEHYLIMEYVEGRTLKEVIVENGPLSLDRSLDYIHQILAGLNHAHSFGVVHRDIKPQNIMITSAGKIKIMDFGLAKSITDNTINYDTGVFGSVYYIAPEIAKKGSGDARVDIYSAGIVLYEMLTKKLPYGGDSPIAIALKHVEGEYLSVDDIDEDIPYEVARIVDKAMCVDPGRRYGSAKIMMGDIETAADEYDVTLTPIAEGTTKKPPRKKISYVDDFDEEEYAPKSKKERKQKSKQKDYKDYKDYDGDGGSGKGKKGLIILVSVLAALLLITLGAFVTFKALSAGESSNVDVPNVVGFTLDEAIGALDNAGLTYDVKEVDEEGEPEEVLRQNPAAGKSIKVGGKVTLTIVKAGEKTDVPDVVGMDADEATAILENAGFKVTVSEEASDSVEAGNVIKQTPAANTKLAQGKKIVLTVSTGKEQIAVPNLVGLTEDDAMAKLSNAGLKCNVISREYSSTVEEGSVTYQNYEAGEEVETGTIVNIKISKGVNPGGGGGGDTPGGEGGNTPGGNTHGGGTDNPADNAEKE